MSVGLVSKARKERKLARLSEDRKSHDQIRQDWANIKLEDDARREE